MEISGKVTVDNECIFVQMGVVNILLRTKDKCDLNQYENKMINATGRLIGRESNIFEVDEIREI
jgi:hypothetical protein